MLENQISYNLRGDFSLKIEKLEKKTLVDNKILPSF